MSTRRGMEALKKSQHTRISREKAKDLLQKREPERKPLECGSESSETKFTDETGRTVHWGGILCPHQDEPNRVKQSKSAAKIYPFLSIAYISMLSTVLPGQPILLPARSPVPQLGPGVYERDGQIRASLLGVPRFEGSVRHLLRL